ncbi:unnamed protein product [Candidula unifasciata]|uniref:Lipoma HMGIC fusion partner-like protein n=1 Tax=Candidula unifasciata TaxID=100452 RepID=A0A8S3Z9V9_9EUPU|nr:unnamed protein product [Candidula unifasciata]
MGGTHVGKIWAISSCIASMACATGYYFPYWMEGTYMSNSGGVVAVYFGLFRKCPEIHAGEDGTVKVLENCGRYGGFYDIPSISWQISTILTGVGTSLSVLVAVSALVSLFFSDLVTWLLTRLAGILQMSAGVLVIMGVMIYPRGWDATEVIQACGPMSGAYQLGDCSLHWSLYMTATGGAITIVCSVFSCHVFRGKSYRTSYSV